MLWKTKQHLTEALQASSKPKSQAGPCQKDKRPRYDQSGESTTTTTAMF